MVRAGWEVRLLPEMGGTWEEMPTNLVDLLGRERRWCQGNLQHLRVLPWPGLTPASRWHLAVGILSYGDAAALDRLPRRRRVARRAHRRSRPPRLRADRHRRRRARARRPHRRGAGAAEAPEPRPRRSPSPERRDAFGGTRALLASAALEQVVWVLLWPVMTLFTAGAVVSTFFGRVVRWDAQARDDRKVSWAEACRLQADALVVGALVGLALVLAGDPGSPSGWRRWRSPC